MRLARWIWSHLESSAGWCPLVSTSKSAICAKKQTGSTIFHVLQPNTYQGQFLDRLLVPQASDFWHWAGVRSPTDKLLWWLLGRSLLAEWPLFDHFTKPSSIRPTALCGICKEIYYGLEGSISSAPLPVCYCPFRIPFGLTISEGKWLDIHATHLPHCQVLRCTFDVAL